MKPIRTLTKRVDGKKTYGLLLVLFAAEAYFAYQAEPVGLGDAKVESLVELMLATGVIAAMRHAVQKAIDGYKSLRRNARYPTEE